MKTKAALFGMLLLVPLSCSRDLTRVDAGEHGSAGHSGAVSTRANLKHAGEGGIAEPAPAAVLAGDGGDEDNQDLASVEQADRFLNERYGDLLPRSMEQQAAVAAADQYLNQRGFIIAEPRRYLVRKVSSGWQVTVASLEAMRRAEQKRGRDLIVSVVDKNGHPEGVSVSTR